MANTYDLMASLLGKMRGFHYFPSKLQDFYAVYYLSPLKAKMPDQSHSF